MKTLLWLDDIRDPYFWLLKTPFWNYRICCVKSYNEFVEYIENNELPDIICFDHDLGDKSDNEKTGYDCAKYLVEYCIDNKCDIPNFYIQSDNGPGSKNINKILSNYHKFYINEINSKS